MVKKIIDIFPPKSSSPSTIEEKPKLFQKQKYQSLPQKNKKNGLWKKWLAVILLILISTFSYLHFFLAKTSLEIWPKTEVFNGSQRIIVDAKNNQSDLQEGIIPGKIFEQEKTVSEEFAASGSVPKKAEGVIRLYNSYTTRSEIWRQGTRFVSSEGKLFLSKGSINVPGAAIKNGKLVASSVDVLVIAAKGGPEYNIGASNFSIAAFLGTPKYTQYYGESSESMAGGKIALQVTEDDLKSAEESLLGKFESQLEGEVENKLPKGFVFLSGGQHAEILGKSSSAKIGDETEKFTFEIKAKLTTVSFESEDIEDYVMPTIIAQIPQSKKIYRESLQIKYVSENLNMDLQQLSLTVEVSAKTYQEIDLDSLRKVLLGRQLGEAEVLLQNFPEINHYSIKVFPFWRSTIPDKIDKVSTALRFDSVRK